MPYNFWNLPAPFIGVPPRILGTSFRGSASALISAWSHKEYPFIVTGVPSIPLMTRTTYSVVILDVPAAEGRCGSAPFMHDGDLEDTHTMSLWVRLTIRQRLSCAFAGPLLKGVPRTALSVFPCG